MQKCVDIVVVLSNIKAIEQPSNHNNSNNKKQRINGTAINILL